MRKMSKRMFLLSKKKQIDFYNILRFSKRLRKNNPYAFVKIKKYFMQKFSKFQISKKYFTKDFFKKFANLKFFKNKSDQKRFIYNIKNKKEKIFKFFF